MHVLYICLLRAWIEQRCSRLCCWAIRTLTQYVIFPVLDFFANRFYVCLCVLCYLLHIFIMFMENPSGTGRSKSTLYAMARAASGPAPIKNSQIVKKTV